MEYITSVVVTECIYKHIHKEYELETLLLIIQFINTKVKSAKIKLHFIPFLIRTDIKIKVSFNYIFKSNF